MLLSLFSLNQTRLLRCQWLFSRVSSPNLKFKSVWTSATNRRFLTQPGIEISVTEEPLGLPAESGYGFPLIEFGESLGSENRYVIVRKLSYGTCSSIWLARDQLKDKFVAIKVLNGYVTGVMRKGLCWEIDALKRISGTSGSSPHCLSILDTFTQPGKGSTGEHACIVTEVLGGDVGSIQRRHKQKLPLPLVKRILLHTLRGIAHTHKNGVVHTDIKIENIFFDTQMTKGDIENLIESEPSRRHELDKTPEGTLRAAVSQPLPQPSIEEALGRTFLLADFGSAQPIDTHIYNEISPVALRAPENYLGGPWNEKVDIWMFGCLIFELLTYKSLFEYEHSKRFNLNELEYMLFQMITFCEETFTPEQLNESPLAGNYFDSTCKLNNYPGKLEYGFDKCLKPFISEGDIASTAALMKRCLRLDPKNRYSAEELLKDPWFTEVQMET